MSRKSFWNSIPSIGHDCVSAENNYGTYEIQIKIKKIWHEIVSYVYGDNEIQYLKLHYA